MHRVFFDTNEGNGQRYALWLPRSLLDLREIGEDLKDGLRVIIYMPDELEMQAVLKFDKNLDAWLADTIEGTTIYYD